MNETKEIFWTTGVIKLYRMGLAFMLRTTVLLHDDPKVIFYKKKAANFSWLRGLFFMVMDNNNPVNSQIDSLA